MAKWRHFICGLGFGVAVTAGAAQVGAHCVVRARQLSLEGVTVQPAGGDAFKLDLRSVPAHALLPLQPGGLATIEVEGPLKFTARRKHLWLSVLADFTSADGLVTLRRGAKLVHARVSGDSVLASAVEYTDDVLPGEDKDAQKYVTAIRLPCAILALDEPEAEEWEEVSEFEEPVSDTPDAIWWEPKTATSRVRLYAGPWLGARSVDIVDKACDECIDFIQVEERGAWLKVERSAEGVVTRGWLRRSALKKSPPELIHGHAAGCSGDHGGGLGGESSAAVPVYNGPATLRAHTQIYVEPAHGVWASVVEDIPVQVRYYSGSDWAQLSDVPGVWSGVTGIEWLNAYVPLSAVVIPTGGAKP